MRNDLFRVICKIQQAHYWKDSTNSICLEVNAWHGEESRQPYSGLECGDNLQLAHWKSSTEIVLLSERKCWVKSSLNQSIAFLFACFFQHV